MTRSIAQALWTDSAANRRTRRIIGTRLANDTKGAGPRHDPHEHLKMLRALQAPKHLL